MEEENLYQAQTKLGSCTVTNRRIIIREGGSVRQILLLQVGEVIALPDNSAKLFSRTPVVNIQLANGTGTEIICPSWDSARLLASKIQDAMTSF